MEVFASVLLAIQVVSSLSIILLVLLQQGKGADMGSAFGSGSAGSLFGATGAANFLSRMTKWAAIIFFASTIGLAWAAHHPGGSILDAGIMQGFESQPEVPGNSEVPGGAAIPGAANPEIPSVVAPAASVPDMPAEPAAEPSASQDAAVPAAAGTDQPASAATNH